MPVILIIDDDEVITETTKILLQKAGYTTLTAANGAKGLRLCQEHHIDVVITDIIMPEKEGLETIRELRKKFPNVRIIAMSGGGRIDAHNYLSMAAMLGAHRTIAKPFRRHALLAAVEEVLK